MIFFYYICPMQKRIKEITAMASLYEQVSQKHATVYTIEECLLRQSKGQFLSLQDKQRVLKYAEEKRKERQKKK